MLKNILFSVLIIVLISFLFGCEKCKNCVSTSETTTNEDIAGYPISTRIEKEVCGRRYIKDYESSGNSTSFSTTQLSDGTIIEVTNKTETICY